MATKPCPEDVEHFLTHGFVRIPQAIASDKVSSVTPELWNRLAYSPTDKTTWLSYHVNMPCHERFALQKFSPKAWGGSVSDGFICNFGREKWDEMNKKLLAGKEGAENPNDPKKLDNWHVDGDFFVYFLDSREQDLLAIPLFSDVVSGGGPTMICPEGIGKLAKWLMDHPQGVMPRMRPADWPQEGGGTSSEFNGEGWYNTIQGCIDFREMTGMGCYPHASMLNSASRNLLRTHRIIINPLVSLYRPFNFDRSNPSEYSVVERKSLKELAKVQKDPSLETGLKGCNMVGERRLLNPEWLKVQAEMKRLEEARLRGEIVDGNKEALTAMLMT